jgi:hypothetical protein
MLRLIRYLLRIPPPLITREQAVEIARQWGEANGYGATNPRAEERVWTWIVWLTPDRDPSPYMYVDNRTGEIDRVRTLPR